MVKSHLNLNDLKKMEQILNIKIESRFALMTLKDGSRMTTEIHTLKTGAMAFLNISNATTFQFESSEELDKYLDKKFEMFASDKDMYQLFTGMDDETWEEWNS